MTYTPDDPDGALTRYAAAYRAIEERGDLLTTALEQQREDQALGAAWRRCEAALPAGWGIGIEPQRKGGYLAGASPDTLWHWTVSGSTPTAALEALAEKLESLRP